MRRTPTESKFLDELVRDCITYGLKEEEGLEYIKSKFGEIKSRSFQQRKAKLLSEGSARIWFDWFTRIGFVLNHKKHVEDLQKAQDDTMHQFYVESQKKIRTFTRIIICDILSKIIIKCCFPSVVTFHLLLTIPIRKNMPPITHRTNPAISGPYDTYVQADVIEYAVPIIIRPKTRHIIPPAICCPLLMFALILLLLFFPAILEEPDFLLSNPFGRVIPFSLVFFDSCSK